MAHRIANGMAIAMAVDSEQNMAHSTPLHSTTSVAASCGSRTSMSEPELTVTYPHRIGFGAGK